MDLQQPVDALLPPPAAAAASPPAPASSASCCSTRLRNRRELQFSPISDPFPPPEPAVSPQAPSPDVGQPPAPPPTPEPTPAPPPEPYSSWPPIRETQSPPAPAMPAPVTFAPTRAPTPQTLTPEIQPRPPETSPPLLLPLEGGKTGLIVGAFAGSVAFVICLGLFVWFVLRGRRRKFVASRQQVPGAISEKVKSMEGEFEKWAGPRRFGYSELAMATKFFSEEEKLGQGGFGLVYHGYLKDMNLHVTVKRVAKGYQQGKNEYISEVRAISQLRHRNLVQLIGWCHDDNELLLVYQMMPNGSLDSHIHNQSKVLSFQLRYEILLGIGSAILYLREEWEQCVLHRDIKPSNMMLDASFHVKLGDFGLARLIDHGQGSHTTVRAGTMGYMDPESMVTGRGSTESDVYSFGVVALEILCGRRPLLVMQGKGGFTMQLVQLIWEFYGDGWIVDTADPRLNGEFDRQKMERLMVAALWCVRPDRSQRPSIAWPSM